MNLQEKLSGLKGLVSHSHSKRRFKSDLTVDMISPPLSDFRHTMHVGRGGDVFGDTSFLSNHGGSAKSNNRDTDSISSPDNKIGAFFSRTLRQIRRGSDNRPREAPKELSPPPPPVSPIIKNAISLPRLDVDMSNGSPTTKVLFPSSQSTPEDKKSSYGEFRNDFFFKSQSSCLLLPLKLFFVPKLHLYSLFWIHSPCGLNMDLIMNSSPAHPTHKLTGLGLRKKTLALWISFFYKLALIYCSVKVGILSHGADL